MDAIQFDVLGVPQLRRGEQSLALTRAKGIAVLLYLAVTRVAQPRERVLDLLWPKSLPAAARKNMRNTLWAIGEALGEDVFEQDSATLRLSATMVVDVYSLEDGLLLLQSGSVKALEQAVAVYHGPLADGLVIHEAPEFEVWLATERERLTDIYLRLLSRIIDLHRAAGDWQAMQHYAQRAVTADPLREASHLALIEAQVWLGLRAQAVQEYAALAAVLERELGVSPLPETTARYEALLSDGTQTLASYLPVPTRHAEPAVPFVGRAAELAALNDEYARAAQGNARVVLITGDLGMGKSELWRTWVRTRIPATHALTTHALETSEPVPFGPLLTLFRQPGPLRQMLSPPSALAPVWLAELSRLLPEIAAYWPGLAPLALPPAEERARLWQALSEVFRLLAQSPLVLVIDDLHWADPSTLDWLVYLVDQLRDAPLLVIGTYRMQDASARLTLAAAGWQRQGQLHHIALSHLAETEAHTLLAALHSTDNPRLTNYWIEQSGGNPYFLIELQRASSDEPPGDLAALVRARVQATVSDAAIQVLQAAAVLGESADFATLRATSGRSEEETLDALDVLDAAAVLRARGSTYHFIHPLVATVVHQDLSPARRAFLNWRAAHALERANASQPERVAERLMEHYAAAGELERAAHYAEQAAMQAFKIGAFVEAAAFARRALSYETTAQRQLLLGQVLVTTDNASEAQTLLEAALYSFERADDAVGATRASILLAQKAIGVSQPNVARAWLQHAQLDRIQELHPALSAQAHLMAAGAERQSRAYDTAAAQLDRAAQLVQHHHLPALAAQIAFERGNLLANRGDLPAAIVAFEETLRLSQQATLPIYEAMAHNNLAYHLLLASDLDGAQAHIRAAEALTQRSSIGFLWQYVYSTTGEIALARGQLHAAETAFERAFEWAQAWNNHVHMANVRVNQALVAQAHGEIERARALLDEARKWFGNAVDPFVRDKIARVIKKF